MEILVFNVRLGIRNVPTVSGFVDIHDFICWRISGFADTDTEGVGESPDLLIQVLGSFSEMEDSFSDLPSNPCHWLIR